MKGEGRGRNLPSFFLHTITNHDDDCLFFFFTKNSLHTFLSYFFYN